MKKLTPVLIVDEIEPCLTFWVDQLGFKKTVEVPDGDKLGFVMLNVGSTEVKLQTRASLKKDVPDLAEGPYRTNIYIEVTDLDAVEGALENVDYVFERRQTFYGATEIAVREPGGNNVIFAQF